VSTASTRVTLAGSHRRVDVALDSSLPVGLLVPEALRLLDEPPGTATGAFVATLPDGRALGPEESLAGAGVLDGTMLRISHRSQLASAPIVLDVTDVTADDVATRPGRWSDRAREVAATAGAVGSSLGASLLLHRAEGWVPAAVLAGVLAVLGLTWRHRSPASAGVALLLSAGAAALVCTPDVAASTVLRTGWVAAVAGVVVLLVSVALRAVRAGLIGVATLALHGGLWAALEASGVARERTAASVAVLAVLVLGLLPQLVVLLSGLARLDDRVVDGEVVAPLQVDAALDTAHRAVLLGVVAAGAAFAAAAGWLAVKGTGWSIALVLLTAVTVLLRARTFPLSVPLLACVVAPVAVGGALVARWSTVHAGVLAPVAVALAGTAIALAVLIWRPSPQLRARARVLADRVEALSVLAAVPVLVGVYGVYGRLLDVAS
jgi:type VII secretion integral membrane protein EccD